MVYRVLAIDDDANLVDMIKDELGDRGFDCETCESAEAALDIWKNQGFDAFQAILCDFKLPGLDGLELLTQVRSRGELVPFVILTGFSDQQMAQQAMNLGAFDFLRKPFNICELVRCLTAACEWGDSWVHNRPKILKFFAQGHNTPQNRQILHQLIASQKAQMIDRFLEQAIRLPGAS